MIGVVYRPLTRIMFFMVLATVLCTSIEDRSFITCLKSPY
jgi:hypothetical protein